MFLEKIIYIFNRLQIFKGLSYGLSSYVLPGFKAGAAGTVYYTDTNQGLTHRPVLINEANHTVFGEGFTKLTIDNVNRNPDIATVIINENSSYYEVDELEMRNHGVLHIHGSNSTFVVHNFTGDRTGLVHLRPGQKMFVQVVESKKGKGGSSILI